MTHYNKVIEYENSVTFIFSSSTTLLLRVLESLEATSIGKPSDEEMDLMEALESEGAIGVAPYQVQSKKKVMESTGLDRGKQIAADGCSFSSPSSCLLA